MKKFIILCLLMAGLSTFGQGIPIVSQHVFNALTIGNASSTSNALANMGAGLVVTATGTNVLTSGLTNNNTGSVTFNGSVTHNAGVIMPNLSTGHVVGVDNTGALATPANSQMSGTLTAGFFSGDGSQLVNIPAGAAGAQPTNANLTGYSQIPTNVFISSASALAAISATNSANLATTTGLVTSVSNNLSAAFLATNLLYFGQATNFSATQNTNFVTATTNLIGVTGSGYGVDGTYQTASSSLWTNIKNPSLNILLSAGTFFIQSNSVSIYSFTTLPSYATIVNGVNPVPIVYYGRNRNNNGTIDTGWSNNTNQTAQTIALINQFIGEPTNGVSTNYHGVLSFTNQANIFAGTFSGNGAGLSLANYALTNLAEIHLFTNNIAYVNGMWTNWPSSTSCGINEIQSLFPWTTNGINSGYHIIIAPGLYPFTSKIGISNNCIIEGAGFASTVFQYVGTTNAFTVAGVTSSVPTSILWNVPTNTIGIPYPPSTISQIGPNVVFKNFTIMVSSNMPAIEFHSMAYNTAIYGMGFGGPDFLNAHLVGNFHTGWVEPADMTNQPALIGALVEGSSIQKVDDCYFGELADGLIFQESGYSYATGDQEYTIGQWTSNSITQYSTIYSTNSIFCLGAGVMAPTTYFCVISKNLSYKCIGGIVLNNGIDVDEIDQFSKYQAAIFQGGEVYSDNGIYIWNEIFTPAGYIYTNTLSDNLEVLEQHNTIANGGGGPLSGIGESWLFNKGIVFGYDNGLGAGNDFIINGQYPVTANLLNATNYSGANLIGLVSSNHISSLNASQIQGAITASNLSGTVTSNQIVSVNAGQVVGAIAGTGFATNYSGVLSLSNPASYFYAGSVQSSNSMQSGGLLINGNTNAAGVLAPSGVYWVFSGNNLNGGLQKGEDELFFGGIGNIFNHTNGTALDWHGIMLGGVSNEIRSSQWSQNSNNVIVGGEHNLIIDTQVTSPLTSFNDNTILGGGWNIISNGNYSVAMGKWAFAATNNVIVISDGTQGYLVDTNPNTVDISAGNGMFVYGSGITINGAAVVTNTPAGISGYTITNAFITNSVFAGNGGGLTNLNAGYVVGSGTAPTVVSLSPNVMVNSVTGNSQSFSVIFSISNTIASTVGLYSNFFSVTFSVPITPGIYYQIPYSHTGTNSVFMIDKYGGAATSDITTNGFIYGWGTVNAVPANTTTTNIQVDFHVWR